MNSGEIVLGKVDSVCVFVSVKERERQRESKENYTHAMTSNPS